MPWVTSEMFFRTFKQLLGCRHLLSDKHNGVEIQASWAMIVCMLILISIGERPNRAMEQMVWYYLIGLAGTWGLLLRGPGLIREGVPESSSGLWEQAKPWMAKRSGHAVNEGLEGRSERQARGFGQPRPTQDFAPTSNPTGAHSPQPPCRTGLSGWPWMAFDTNTQLARFAWPPSRSKLVWPGA